MHHCPVWITLQKAANNSELEVKKYNDKENKGISSEGSELQPQRSQ